MSSHDLHTLTGAYAADALDDAEHVAFDAHLEVCEACRLEVAELRATTARMALAVWAEAPAELRSRVLAEVAHTRQDSLLAPVTDLSARRAARPWYQQPATAAAAVLLVVSAGLGGLAVNQNRAADDATTLARALAAVAADPDRSEQTLRLPTGGRVTVVSSHGLAVFRGDLPALPEGKAYQLWRLTGQRSQSAGVLGRGGELTGVVRDVAAADVVGVTVEPAAGSDQPTTDPVVLVPLA